MHNMTSYPYSDPSDRFYRPGELDDKHTYTGEFCAICGERIAVGDEIVRIGGEAVYHRECFEDDVPYELLRDVGVILQDAAERWD